MTQLSLVSFSNLANTELTAPQAIASLENMDKDKFYSEAVQLARPGSKFSWLVLGDYYQLCNFKGLIPSEERNEADWSRNHFDRSPESRMAAVANVTHTLMTEVLSAASQAQRSAPLSSSTSTSHAPSEAAPSREYLASVMQDTLQTLRVEKYTSPNGITHPLSIDRIRTEKFGPTSKRSTQSTHPTDLSIQERDCLRVAEELARKGLNPLVLDLANAKCPGGGYLRGARAQEEDLCRRSGLSLALDSKQNSRLDPQLYPFGPREGVYASDVPVFRGDRTTHYAYLDQPFTAAFGAIAAPNKPHLKNGRLNYTDQENIRGALRNLFNLAVQKGHRSLVLGALGCGAFINPPDHVAEIFMNVICKDFQGCFTEIVFAIIEDKNSHQSHNPKGNFLPFAAAVENVGGKVFKKD